MPCSRIQAAKSLDCLSYQCCEGEIPETSALYKTIDKVRNSICRSIVSNLKEYDTAKWDD